MEGWRAANKSFDRGFRDGQQYGRQEGWNTGWKAALELFRKNPKALEFDKDDNEDKATDKDNELSRDSKDKAKDKDDEVDKDSGTDKKSFWM